MPYVGFMEASEAPPAATCMVEFIVDLPDPVPSTPADFEAGNIEFRVRVSTTWHGGTFTDIDLSINTDPLFPTYSYEGLDYPTGLDTWRDVTWFEWLGGIYPADENLFSFKYDSGENKLYVRSYAPVFAYEDIFQFLRINVEGLAAEVGEDELMCSVTQSFNGGTPDNLELIDDSFGYSEYEYETDVFVGTRPLGFAQVHQTPCGGPDVELACEDEVIPGRFPWTVTIQVPDDDDVVSSSNAHPLDDYFWYVYGRVAVWDAGCDYGSRLFYLGSGDNTIVTTGGGSINWPATLEYSFDIWDPVEETLATITMMASRTGTELTITIDCDSPNITPYQHWTPAAFPPHSLSTVPGSGWWYYEIIGENGTNGWIEDSYEATATIELSNPTESDAPPEEYKSWDDGGANLAYNYFFVPYLTEEHP